MEMKIRYEIVRELKTPEITNRRIPGLIVDLDEVFLKPRLQTEKYF